MTNNPFAFGYTSSASIPNNPFAMGYVPPTPPPSPSPAYHVRRESPQEKIIRLQDNPNNMEKLPYCNVQTLKRKVLMDNTFQVEDIEKYLEELGPVWFGKDTWIRCITYFNGKRNRRRCELKGHLLNAVFDRRPVVRSSPY